MDITPYVDSLRRDLAAAAEAGGPEARAAAERLSLALDPAMRLALMEALSQAAAEITSELPAGSVDVRLRGREPELVVDVPTVPIAAATSTGPPLPPEKGEEDEDDAVARITLRIPESLKARAEEMAARTGHSLNTWLVTTIRNATRDHAVNVDIDLSSLPFFEEMQRGPGHRGGRRMTGWV
ncbi:MAG: toxin-antitoxin system HicB family antitoxin [Nocardioidaceae bacterium]